MRMTAPETCHHVQDDDGAWVHIPGCWAAIHDPSECICEVDGSELERALHGRREAEAQRDTAKTMLHEVMMQIVARPDMQSLFGPAETEIWELARAFLNEGQRT